MKIVSMGGLGNFSVHLSFRKNVPFNWQIISKATKKYTSAFKPVTETTKLISLIIIYLDLGLDVFDGITGLDLEGDGLAGQRLDEDLHASPQPQDQVKGGLLLDVVIGQGPAVLQLLAGEDQPLLVRGDALLVLQQNHK